MAEKTNKELLELVLEQTKKNAQSQLDFACKVSNFMNEQALFNAEIRGYLESNSRTNQKGIIEQLSINTKDISDLKTEKKIERTTAGIIGGAIGSVATYLSKFLF